MNISSLRQAFFIWPKPEAQTASAHCQLRISFVEGKYHVRDWAGHLTTTESLEEVGALIRLEAKNSGYVRDLLTPTKFSLEDLDL